ncbi:MAG: class I SAM-dependent methyltransferase [Verrucomicrobiales bacterium]|nr:class I SAM-dependent methyltransferase [Verrucomicrobiales bacterium]
MSKSAVRPFSKEPEYLELNRQFVQRVIPHLQGLDCVVDLACGTGTLTDLFLAELQNDTASAPTAVWPAGSPELTVIGLDLSLGSLKLAHDHFATLTSSSSTSTASLERQGTVRCLRPIFVKASGDRLPLANAVANLVLLGNAIHCFTDKQRLLEEVRRVLRPGGVFAFNSSFYAGSIVPGTEAFYQEWMKGALHYIKGREEELRSSGKGGPLRKRGRGQPAFSNRWLTPLEFTQALKDHAFDVKHVTERRIGMLRHHFEGASANTGGWEAELATVLLSGYPVELACEALGSSVGPAFDTLGVESIPRSWLEVIAAKS